MVPELSVFVVAECLTNLGTPKHYCQEVREHRYEHLKHTLKLLWGGGRDRVICSSILVSGARDVNFNIMYHCKIYARNSTTSMIISKLLHSN